MISENTFASGFGSAWASIAPTTERFVRRANKAPEREAPPILAVSAASRRALINELGFGISAEKLAGNALSDQALAKIFERVTDRLGKYEGVTADQLSWPSTSEWREVREIENAILGFVASRGSFGADVVPRPRFSGCGFIDECDGDLLIGTCLVEIKSGERAFRAKDLRQTLIYCALNSLKNRYQIESICLFNPRRGISVDAELKNLALEVASKPLTNLLSEIVYFVSSGDISK